jgi:hypothetical protein
MAETSSDVSETSSDVSDAEDIDLKNVDPRNSVILLSTLGRDANSGIESGTHTIYRPKGRRDYNSLDRQVLDDFHGKLRETRSTSTNEHDFIEKSECVAHEATLKACGLSLDATPDSWPSLRFYNHPEVDMEGQEQLYDIQTIPRLDDEATGTSTVRMPLTSTSKNRVHRGAGRIGKPTFPSGTGSRPKAASRSPGDVSKTRGERLKELRKQRPASALEASSLGRETEPWVHDDDEMKG